MLSWQHQHPSFFHLPNKQTKLSPLLASFSPISTDSSPLSFCRFRNNSVVFFFSSRKRERDMQSVVLNPTCYCRAQQARDTSCSSPPPPAILYKVSSSPCLNFFLLFFCVLTLNNWIPYSQSRSSFFGTHSRSPSHLRLGITCRSLRIRSPSFTRRRPGSFSFFSLL